jgi:hypothetical protein
LDVSLVDDDMAPIMWEMLAGGMERDLWPTHDIPLDTLIGLMQLQQDYEVE